jgi:hypothetical protein
MSDLNKEVLHTLLYSEIFRHPLVVSEIRQYLSVDTTHSDISNVLEQLVDQQLIGKNGKYFFVFEEAEKIEKRTNGGERAEKMMPKAQKVARFIHKFPFIEGVGISGSLSKGILHSDADFDFFIVTKPQRLWVARTLLILYKKVFLLNSRKYFFVNYFVVDDHFEIEVKISFRATEIATLIPASGKVLDQFYQSNAWVESYFPNAMAEKESSSIAKKPFWSRCMSSILKGKFGESMDSRFMRFTLKRWQKKFGDFNNEKFDLTMKTRKYISKHHPNDFQNKVLTKHATLIEQYKVAYADQLEKHNIEL